MPKAEKVTFNPALLAAMVAQAPLNLDKATKLADEYDVKVKSVIAKAIREKIAYEKQVRVRKDGKPVASKNATVGRIEEMLALDVGALDGLEKAAKASLEALVSALHAHVEVESETE